MKYILDFGRKRRPMIALRGVPVRMCFSPSFQPVYGGRVRREDELLKGMKSSITLPLGDLMIRFLPRAPSRCRISLFSVASSQRRRTAWAG